jgi:hypothetical protein
MIGIPGQFERDLTDINTLHASIVCKVQIIRNAGLRTTTHGDIRVDATRMIEKTRAQIEALLKDYQTMVMAAARGEKISRDV